MKSCIGTTKEVKSVAKQSFVAGLKVQQTSETLTVTSWDNELIYKAILTTGKNWLVRYDERHFAQPAL